MKYIGNIVTNFKIEISSFFNITSDYNSVDTSIPTLIIGWKNVKELFPEQNILCNKIKDNVYWTFSKREKRYRYENDLEQFISMVVKEVNKNANYHFFNYAIATKNRRENFISYIKKGNCSIYYNSRFLYVYNILDSTTIGISLNDLSYIGINTKLFINELSTSNNILCDNLNFIDNESFLLIKDNIKIAAYLNYLKNSDIYKKNITND